MYEKASDADTLILYPASGDENELVIVINSTSPLAWGFKFIHHTVDTKISEKLIPIVVIIRFVSWILILLSIIH